MMDEPLVTQLGNGLRVATLRMPWAETVSISCWVDVGARYEDEKNHGISHMLEHMAFKGTTRRSARDIAVEFDAIGGNFNAYTSMEHTVYYAKVLKRDLTLAADILGDILTHSVFDKEELAREQGVVLQEIAMYNDAPDELVYDYFSETAYAEQPIGRSILGTPERVSSFTRDDLCRYVESHYHGGNMVLAATGNVDHAELIALAEKSFASLPAGAAAPKDAARYTGGRYFKERDFEQAHLVLGLNGLSTLDEDYRTLQLLSMAMGGGMSSRLFQEVREKRGLAYSVYSYANAYTDTGVLSIYAATSAEQAPELLEVLCDEARHFARNIDEEMLERARNQLKAGMLMTEESTSSQAEILGRHLLTYGRYLPTPEVMGRIDAVTLEDIHRVMDKLLRAGTPTLAAVGPVEELEKAQGALEGLAQ
ncbi:MAG: insulinase family protein [Alphaproteobacteria bacterium]|nr:insulinase family protein [Alphaproteobacteria bacterium]